MYKNLTKDRMLEGMKICKKHGYWSKEVLEYTRKFSYSSRMKLQNMLCSLYNSTNFKNSSIYELAKENNLL